MFQRGKYGRYINSTLTLIDFVVLNLSFLATELLNPGMTEMRTKLTWLLLNVAYIPAAMWITGIHRERSLQMDRVIRSSLLATATHLLCFVSLLYIMELTSIEWTMLAEFYVILAFALTLWRVMARSILKHYRRRGGNKHSVVIVGCGNTAMRLYEEMCSDTGFGYDVLGFFDLYCHPDFPYKELYAGNLDSLKEFVATHKVDELFYTLSGENREAVQTSLGVCDAHMAKFNYVPQISPYLTRNFQQGQIGFVPVLSVLNNPLESPINAVMKRGFDILFSSLFLLVSPLIFVPVAIAIKISSPGPVFFRQKRTGYMGGEFWCYKFRTMKVNDDSDSVQATRDDPRKTRLGDFLRRTSIDELPQFYNVLKGDMSVVGPRPHMLKHTEIYSSLIRNYMVRHFIKPGITGWAQVRGYRGQTEELWQMEKRVEHDIWYIEHWSFLLDMKIIARTVINALRKDDNAF